MSDNQPRFSHRWGIEIPKKYNKYMNLPSMFLYYYSRVKWTKNDGTTGMGVSCDELTLLLLLADKKYELKNSKSKPSNVYLENMMNKNERTVQRIKKSLREKNLLKQKPSPKKEPPTYDYTPFSRAILQAIKEDKEGCQSCHPLSSDTDELRQNCHPSDSEQVTDLVMTGDNPVGENYQICHPKNKDKEETINNKEKDMQINSNLPSHPHTDLLYKPVYCKTKNDEYQEGVVIKINPKTLKVISKEWGNVPRNIKLESVFYQNGGPGLSEVVEGESTQNDKLPPEVAEIKTALMDILPHFKETNPMKPSKWQFIEVLKTAKDLYKGEVKAEKIAEFSIWYSDFYWEGIQGNALSIQKMMKLWPSFEKWISDGKPETQRSNGRSSRPRVTDIKITNLYTASS